MEGVLGEGEEEEEEVNEWMDGWMIDDVWNGALRGSVDIPRYQDELHLLRVGMVVRWSEKQERSEQ